VKWGILSFVLMVSSAKIVCECSAAQQSQSASPDKSAAAGHDESARQ
jgi:hypothetical protein